MAADRHIGEFVERLMRDAEANFPQLAPIRLARDMGRDVWRVLTRRGEFQFTEDFIGRGRRPLVEFLVYQFTQLVRRAEYEDRNRHPLQRVDMPADALQPRIGAPMELRVGDRITVNGVETRIVHVGHGVVTVEHLQARGLVEVGRCDCEGCREGRRRQAEGHDYDALRYGMWNDPTERARVDPAAEARSIQLLRRNLTPRQLQQWEDEQAIEVRGGETGIRYRIRGQISSFNIDRLGGTRGRVCCTPGYPGDLPLGDYVLGQKLALELDELNFLGEANLQLDGAPRVPIARDARVPRGVVTTNEDLDRLFRETYGAAVL